MQHAHHRTAADEAGTVMLRFRAALACPCCARDVERALRAHPHVRAVHIDAERQEVHVTVRAGAVASADLQALIVRAGHGCRCTPLPNGTPVGGDLPALAHHADRVAITMNTAADRMQYEFPTTGAAHEHHTALPEHEGMAHDLSDPRMARAMERAIRNRFLVALALTVPTVLLSPLAVNTLGIELAPAGWRNWLMLALSTPVVWWSGWPFIGGAASLRGRALNMSVLIATGVLAAWSFSLLFALTTGGETFYEAAAMLVTFVLFGHWLEMKSRRGTTDALRALFDLVPPTATVIRDGVEHEVPTAQIQVGDRIRIAIGASTDVAIETAPVVLRKSDPLDVARAIRLSHTTVRKMKQNLFWASIYNVLAIPVAASVLYPRFGVMLRPEWSALLMSLSSIIVATNAVLLRRVERELLSPRTTAGHGRNRLTPAPRRWPEAGGHGPGRAGAGTAATPAS